MAFSKIIYHHPIGFWVSTLVRYLTRVYLPPVFREICLFILAKALHIDHKASEYSLSKYRTIDAFFTRGLQSSIRPISTEVSALVSPCDGCVIALGKITKSVLLQAKGHTFTIDDLIGEPTEDKWHNASYLTIYLSPKDCHRLYVPFDADIHKVRYIPGYCYPVREPYISHQPGLYSKNERVVTFFDLGDETPLIMAKIGAINVRSISLERPKIRPAELMAKGLVKCNHRVKKGDYFATFHLGSTVILLVPKTVTLDPNLKIGQSVTYGAQIGTI